MSRYSHVSWWFANKENFVDQYLKSANFLFYRKVACSNGICKVRVTGNITLNKLHELFFNNKYLPPVQNVHIEKFKCDGSKFSFNIFSDKFELFDETYIKAWWRDKQIETIFID